MIADFKKNLIKNYNTDCNGCKLRQAQAVPYGNRYPVFTNARVIVLGGSQLSVAKVTRVMNVCAMVYGAEAITFWPSHICLLAGTKKDDKELPKTSCSPITKSLLSRLDYKEKVIIAFESSLFVNEADIVIKDNLHTEMSYATLRFRLTYHKTNGNQFLPKPTKDQYHVLTDGYDDCKDLFSSWIEKNDVVALDTETNTLYAYAEGSDIALIQITGPATTAPMTPTWHGTQTIICDLTKNSLDNYPTLKRLLTNNKFILHNATFDVNFIHNVLGIEIQVEADTILMGHLCKEVRPHGLTTYYAKEVLGWGAYDSSLRKDMKSLRAVMKTNETLIKAKHKNNPIVERPNYTDLNRKTLYDYSAMDTQSVWALKPVLDIIIKQDKLEQMNENYKIMRAGLGLIQRTGVFIDRPRLEWLDRKIATMLDGLTSQYDINLASTTQTASFIFDYLGLPQKKSYKWKDKSVKELALAHLMDNKHVRTILKARTLMKMRGTYTHGFLASLYNDDTIRPSYNITSAKTGRISASNPPLQTIPRPFNRIIDGLDLGAVIRSCVCRPFKGKNPHHEGWYGTTNDYDTEHRGTIVAGDLSQAELRVLAYVSGSEFFNRVYREGRDLHSETARMIFGPNFTKHQRSIGKGFNFVFAYGGDLEQAALAAGATPKVARMAAKKYKELTKDYTAWKKEIVLEIIRNGHIQSPLGRVRRWYNPEKRYEIAKHGPNSLIQGISSDITNLAAAKLALKGYKVFLLWHDGIYIYADNHEVEEVKSALQSELLGTFRQYVPTVPVKMDIDIHPRIYMVEN